MGYQVVWYLKSERITAVQVHPGLPGGQGGVGVVPRLVVVVLHVQVGQLRVLDSQGAAGVVDVLPVQGELRRLGCDHVWILDQCLWIVVSVSISFFLGPKYIPGKCCSWWMSQSSWLSRLWKRSGRWRQVWPGTPCAPRSPWKWMNVNVLSLEFALRYARRQGMFWHMFWHLNLHQDMQEGRTCIWTWEPCSAPQLCSLLHPPELELPETKTNFQLKPKKVSFRFSHLKSRLCGGRGVTVSLVSLERGVVAELHVHAPLPQLRHAVREVVHHRDRRRLLLHLQECLVLALQHQHIGHPAKRNSQVDDLRFCHVVGYIPAKIRM